jgi:hypothetical protein
VTPRAVAADDAVAGHDDRDRVGAERVADGALTGYRGGLQRKRALLELERTGAPAAAWSPRQLALI